MANNSKVRRSAPRKHNQVVGPGGTYDWSSSPAFKDDARQSPWDLGRKPPGMYNKAAFYGPQFYKQADWGTDAANWINNIMTRVGDWWKGLGQHGSALSGAAAARQQAKPAQPAQPQAPAAPAKPATPARIHQGTPYVPAGTPGQVQPASAPQPHMVGPQYLRAKMRGYNTNRYKEIGRPKPDWLPAAPDPLGLSEGSAAAPLYDPAGKFTPEQKGYYLAELSAKYGTPVNHGNMHKYTGGMEFDANGMLRPADEARASYVTPEWWQQRAEGIQTPDGQQMSVDDYRKMWAEEGWQVGPHGSMYNPKYSAGYQQLLNGAAAQYIAQGVAPGQAVELAYEDMVQDQGLYAPYEEAIEGWNKAYGSDMGVLKNYAEVMRMDRLGQYGGAGPGTEAYFNYSPYFMAGNALAPYTTEVGDYLADSYGKPIGSKVLQNAGMIAPYPIAGKILNGAGNLVGQVGSRVAPQLMGKAAPMLARAGSVPLGSSLMLLDSGSKLWDQEKLADELSYMTGTPRTGYGDQMSQMAARYKQLGRDRAGDGNLWANWDFPELIAKNVGNRHDEALQRELSADEWHSMTPEGMRENVVVQALSSSNPLIRQQAGNMIFGMLHPELQQGLVRLMEDPASMDPAERDDIFKLYNQINSIPTDNKVDIYNNARSLTTQGYWNHQR